MSNVGADVLAEWRFIPENVVSLSVFAFGSRGGLVVEGVLISTCRGEALFDERDESRLLMPAGMFFVVIGG